VKRSEVFAIRGAFHRRVTHDSLCPLQVTDREPSSGLRRCASLARLSAPFRPRLTLDAPADASSLPRVRCRDAGLPRVRPREDCHPWARSPFARFPLLTLGKRLRDRRRLPTSADQIRRTGTPIERRHPRPHRNRSPSRGLSSLAFAPCLLSEEQARHGEPNEPCGGGGPDAASEAGQGARSGRQSRVKGLRMAQAPLLRSLPSITLSRARCHERVGVSSAAPLAIAPFGKRWGLAFRTR